MCVEIGITEDIPERYQHADLLLGSSRRPTARKSMSTSSVVCQWLILPKYLCRLKNVDLFERVVLIIYVALEGVLVAKKDFNLPKHPDIDTKNLYVRQQSVLMDARTL
jgi:hypothetical protein